jgi:hypothetical protein
MCNRVEQGVISQKGDLPRPLIKAPFFPTPTPGHRPCLHREGSTRGLANERPERYVYHVIWHPRRAYLRVVRGATGARPNICRRPRIARDGKKHQRAREGGSLGDGAEKESD